jgi:hypothetical protein
MMPPSELIRKPGNTRQQNKRSTPIRAKSSLQTMALIATMRAIRMRHGNQEGPRPLGHTSADGTGMRR